MRWLVALVSRLLVRRRERALRRRLAKRKDAPSLNTYLAFLADHDLPLPLADDALRGALFGMDAWQVSGTPGEFLFAAAQRHLFAHCGPQHKQEWLAWIRLCRVAGRRLDVAGPQTAEALRKAQGLGILAGASEQDRQYLLGLYRDAYAAVLGARDDPAAPELLPALLSYATVLHEAGADEASRRLLERLSAGLRTRPRALAALPDDECLRAPEAGVGSPHRVGITIYHDPLSGAPARVAGAGTTADATLNARLFTDLFAAALACDDEPTLVTSLGWSLAMRPSPRTAASGQRPMLVSAVLTPAGPGEPTASTASLGMTPEEALALIADSFQRLQEATGLVRVMRWEARDAEYVEERIRAALAETRSGSRLLRSEPHHTEGAAVIHVMPLLHRDASGAVVPVEIELPYQSLGTRRVFGLLRKGRSAYMEQLIGAAIRRRMFAHHAWHEQNEAIERWGRLGEPAKQQICREHPTVTITMAYDWELAMPVALPKPELVPRREYEEGHRPQIRESARNVREHFAAMEEKLRSLNQPGGKADTLTFKLLLDSMIRQAPVLIPDRAFQDEYRRWCEVSSAPTWAAIAAWAHTRGLPPEALAADNICFNAAVNPRAGTVRILPMVLLNLHDFAVRIDGDRGLMEALPAGNTPSLAECFEPLRGRRLRSPAELHARFAEWLKSNLPALENRAAVWEGPKATILSDPKIGVLITLGQAKRALFRGDPRAALELLTPLRSADLAAVYFWGAIAEEINHLADLPIGGLPSEPREKAERLLNMAVAVLIDALKARRPGDRPMVELRRPGSPRAGLLGDTISGEALMPKRAKEFLAQLRARDPRFIAGLIAERPDIGELERQSLDLTDEDQEKFHAALSALGALELLALAEKVKDLAQKLPHAGMLPADLRQAIRQLVERKESLEWAPEPWSLPLEELRRLL